MAGAVNGTWGQDRCPTIFWKLLLGELRNAAVFAKEGLMIISEISSFFPFGSSVSLEMTIAEQLIQESMRSPSFFFT